MAFTPKTCDRYIDDFPGIRANCESMIANGKRCVGCPDHPDSPEKRIAALEAEIEEWKLLNRREIGVLTDQLAKVKADHAYAIRMYDQKEKACIDALEKLAAAQAERDDYKADYFRILGERQDDLNRRVGAEAERDTLKEDLRNLEDRYEERVAERDAAVQDAERYRWLCKVAEYQKEPYNDVWQWSVCKERGGQGNAYFGKVKIDAAIDAARKEGE